MAHARCMFIPWVGQALAAPDGRLAGIDDHAT
jgi:hypothetical protein